MAVLDFEPVTHCYTVNGRVLPSVTQVLTAAGFVDPRFYTDEACARGTAVHAAVQQFHAGGELGPVEAEYAPFLDAYLTFTDLTGYAVEASEQRVYDPLRGYAGTYDLLGTLPSYHAGRDLIDIKTGSIPTWVGYQTAAYARLLPGIVRRWALNLRADGSYRLEPLTARSDEAVFLAALTVAHAKAGLL